MNKRIFIKKKIGFQIEALDLKNELIKNLDESEIESIDLYNVYDIFNCEDEDIELLKHKVLSEVVTDDIFENIDLKENYIALEFLPGQYDQRADSASQCLMLLNNKEWIDIKSGKVIVFLGKVKNLNKIKNYLINPIEMREKNLDILENKIEEFNLETKKIENFINLDRKKLVCFLENQGLAMNIEDLEHIQKYFKNTEKRDPTEAEIKVLDTYWSDHCRHTTFETYLKNIKINSNNFKEEIQSIFNKYIELKEKVNPNKKQITMMDMATIGGKYLRKIGKLNDLEISEEINACSIEVDVEVDNEIEKWLLMFKNETHNHPTEIEPFGGASTCVGGAIRDPLSGRSYVYQGMRISGAGDITENINKTLENKLSQERISKGAAQGYSSYGNQIGLSTTFVKEIYHEGYKAKRMEVGAVVGAVKKENVRREEPTFGDIVILIGGKTGRDGVGGATGSSKEHTDQSLLKCSSEVQKGNAPMERRIQRLFRNSEVSKLIKKSNDFGAGGVSVAIGELARGVYVNLDKVPVKYKGLNGMELSISESQERMAVVIEKKDEEKFINLCYEENLEGVTVGEITKDDRLVLVYKGEKVVDISREFLDTNGIKQSQNVEIKDSNLKTPFNKENKLSLKDSIKNILSDLNVASQRGMVEMFDSSIGRSTVLMPYGGKYQLTESEGSVQKLPTDKETKTCSILTYGYNPFITEYSPYLGAQYAVIESLAKVVALGGDFSKVRLTFQEYFEKLGKDEVKWGKPVSSILGALEAQLAFETPAIGGKDSMSGTFKEINVPPTLISFAVTTENVDNIISSEFKEYGSNVYLVSSKRKRNNLPDYENIKENFKLITENIKNKKIISASTIKFGGIMETLLKNSFGNKMGLDIDTDINLFEILPGDFIVESKDELNFGKFIGKTVNSEELKINGELFNINEMIEIWESKLKKIYPLKKESNQEIKSFEINDKEIKKSKNKYEKPKVLIPVFPGNNCEYDSKKAFEKAGGDVELLVFNNLNSKSIKESIEILSEKIRKTQIFMIPGGFSAGDEPDGSGKFIGNVLQNPLIKNSIKELLENDGLILGICNGFQALIKSGLLPYGDVNKLTIESPTLFRNDINRHISRVINTKIVSVNSPWLSSFKKGEIHSIPVSHGEGKVIVKESVAKELFKNGQIVTQYCNEQGEATMDGNYNLNGSSYAIEGMVSKCGQIFGKMAHSERYENGLLKNIYGNKEQDIFLNGVNYFKK
ncbi:phosphoribosylformylglycinamidine synthase [uncultured Cetobacterium sp.]|uniref:phosphoribosylformylglycinamidine synthase n=1 Tax=uncultured Cetobacterium sp. TaxID=527638 RepID=UPI00262B66A9|nr:phosphoribosylformylglycinamidine synthase [uncultured Cetobacterium sp.]